MSPLIIEPAHNLEGPKHTSRDIPMLGRRGGQTSESRVYPFEGALIRTSQLTLQGPTSGSEDSEAH